MARMTTTLLVGYFAWWERRYGGAGRADGDRGVRGDRGDRGDVPGWVMVTVMTAALVVAIATIATPALQDMFTSAISKVTGAGGDSGGG